MRTVKLLTLAVAALVTVWAAVAPLRADSLTTINGEAITGRVLAVTDGEVRIDVSQKKDVEVRTFPLSDLQYVRLVPELAGEDSGTDLFIDNLKSRSRKKRSTDHERTEKIKLREGYHQFTLVYWQGSGNASLVMEVAPPGSEMSAVDRSVLFHVDDDAEIGPSERMDAEEFRRPETIENQSSGVSYEVRDLGDHKITTAAELRGLPQVSKGHLRQIDLSMNHPEKNFAVIFRGFFGIQTEGEYRGKLKSTGDSVLYFGPTPSVLLPSSEDQSDAKWQVRFRHGGSIQGDVKSWEDDACTVRDTVGENRSELAIPVSELTELWSGSAEPEDVAAQREDEPTHLDSVYAKASGDRIQRVSGTVLGINEDALRFEYNGNERTISLDRVVGVVMRKIALPDSDNESAPHRFQFRRAASLPGRLTNLSDETVNFQLPWGTDLVVPRDDVREIVIAKGRFQSLSELEPLELTQTPFFDRVVPMQIDKSLSGGMLQIGEKTYDKGLCMPSRTVISYALDGEFDRFRCELGVQESEGDAGNATVKVLADEVVLLEVAELTGDQEPQEVDLDVSGRQRLTLLVDFGKNLQIGDHVVWANAHLLRGEATP